MCGRRELGTSLGGRRGASVRPRKSSFFFLERGPGRPPGAGRPRLGRGRGADSASEWRTTSRCALRPSCGSPRVRLPLQALNESGGKELLRATSPLGGDDARAVARGAARSGCPRPPSPILESAAGAEGAKPTPTLFPYAWARRRSFCSYIAPPLPVHRPRPAALRVPSGHAVGGELRADSAGHRTHGGQGARRHP